VVIGGKLMYAAMVGNLYCTTDWLVWGRHYFHRPACKV